MTAALVAIGGACAGVPSGGPCAYASYEGSCRFVDLRESRGGPDPANVHVTATYRPSGPSGILRVTKDYVVPPSRVHPLHDWLADRPVVMCRALEIRTGTCNPGSSSVDVADLVPPDEGSAWDAPEVTTRDPATLAKRSTDCASGDAQACALAAFGETDEARVTELAQKACDGESGRGCFLLARAYLHGYSVPLDPGMARATYTRACKLGFQPACDWDKPKPKEPCRPGLRGANCAS